MLSPDTIATIDAYWSAALGAELAGHGQVRVIEHGARLASYHGVYAVRSPNGLILSAPSSLTAAIAPALAHLDAHTAFDSAILVAATGADVERVVGPASIAYVDAATFRGTHAGARMLNARDDGQLRALAAAVTAQEWEHGGITFDRSPIFGAFCGDELAAVCSYEPWGDAILHVGVVAHPGYRGRGYARAAASAATAHGLAAGRFMQWQTLESNAPSLAIGRALGYEPYLRTISLRLR